MLLNAALILMPLSRDPANDLLHLVVLLRASRTPAMLIKAWPLTSAYACRGTITAVHAILANWRQKEMLQKEDQESPLLCETWVPGKLQRHITYAQKWHLRYSCGARIPWHWQWCWAKSLQKLRAGCTEGPEGSWCAGLRRAPSSSCMPVVSEEQKNWQSMKGSNIIACTSWSADSSQLFEGNMWGFEMLGKLSWQC